ncbi:MAG: sulfotransferase domain-containing protein [Chromatiales bacterium]|nr:sulfotransferase domain-containing protein [Chromatiales bacterium]
MRDDHETMVRSPPSAALTDAPCDAGRPRYNLIRDPSRGRPVPYPVAIDEDRVAQVRHGFRPRARDAAIVTYPRSGTTWMQQIVSALLVEAGLHPRDDRRRLAERIPWLEAMSPGSEIWMRSPRVFKTHATHGLAPPIGRFVCVVREPKDVAVSTFHHTRAWRSFAFQGTWARWLALFRAGEVEGGSWAEHVREWVDAAARDPGRVLVVRYEDMHQDPGAVIRRVAAFLGVEVDAAGVARVIDESRFDRMRADPRASHDHLGAFRTADATPFLRRGVRGDWKRHFSAAERRAFDAAIRAELGAAGELLGYPS